MTNDPLKFRATTREGHYTSAIASIVLSGIGATYNQAPDTLFDHIASFVIMSAVFGVLIFTFYSEVAKAAYKRGYK